VNNLLSEALDLKPEPYKSAFSEGLEAAGNGVSWTRCPYTSGSQHYERNEWLRGHAAHSQFN